VPFLFLIVIQLLEEAKNVLAGLADESLELGEKGIFKRGVAQAPEAPKAPDAPDAPETVKAPEKKKAPEGDKVSTDEGKKPDADNKNDGAVEGAKILSDPGIRAFAEIKIKFNYDY